jgi:hypothetical protein
MTEPSRGSTSAGDGQVRHLVGPGAARSGFESVSRKASINALDCSTAELESTASPLPASSPATPASPSRHRSLLDVDPGPVGDPVPARPRPGTSPRRARRRPDRRPGPRQRHGGLRASTRAMTDDNLRRCGAVTQLRLVAAGEVTVPELRELAIATIERLNPTINAVVSPPFDRPGDGIPILLKDACQELAGTSHWCGVAALRDIHSKSEITTPFAAHFVVFADATQTGTAGVGVQPARSSRTARRDRRHSLRRFSARQTPHRRRCRRCTGRVRGRDRSDRGVVGRLRPPCHADDLPASVAAWRNTWLGRMRLARRSI